MTANPSPKGEPLAADTRGSRGWLSPALVVFPVVSALLVIVAVAGVAIGSTAVAWEVVARVIAAKVLPAGWIDPSSVSDADQAIVWLIRTPGSLSRAWSVPPWPLQEPSCRACFATRWPNPASSE